MQTIVTKSNSSRNEYVADCAAAAVAANANADAEH